MRVLCGQCGYVNELDEDSAETTVACARCGRELPLASMTGEKAPAPPAEEVELEEGELGFAEQARQAEGRKITITCAHCGRTATVSARIAGKKARCKGCNRPIEIPFPDDLEDFELPRLYRHAEERETGLELAPPEEVHQTAAPLESIAETEVSLEIAPVDHDGDEAREKVAGYDPAAPLAAMDRAPVAAATEPPAVAEAPQQTGELVSALQDFQGARPEAARARRRRAGGSPAVQWLLILGIGAAAVALPLAVVIPALTMGDPNEDDLAAVIDHDAPDANHTRVGGPGVLPPTTRRVGTRPGPKPAPVAVPPEPKCEVLSAVPMAFATGGHFPASPRSLYWRITVRVTAGDEPVGFRTHGKDVRLTFGEERFDSLGEPDGGTGLFPQPSRKSTVALKPRQGREVTFLFEIPDSRREGGLFIRRVGYRDLVLPPAAPPAAAALVGTWQEAPPRHLKPMLRDPVMAAIQAAPAQHLRVGPGPEGIRLGIPEARVMGTGRAVAPGLYELALDRDEQTLEGGMLRFVEGGRRAILYLADEPYHQITYINPSIQPPAAKPLGKPATPPPPSPGTSRPTGPRPFEPGIHHVGEHEDPPFERKPRPRKTRPGELPSGPSIFD